MKKNIQHTILLVFTSILLSACQKDFLDRYPQTSIAPEEFFKTEEDLSLYINGLLSLPSVYSYQADQSSDNSATTGAIEIKNIMTGTPDSKNITGGWGWGRLRNINYFLENYDRAELPEEDKHHYVGLAKYYRAMFYFDKVQRFSDVPWYSGTLNPDDEALYQARDPRARIVDSVMADLEFAATHVNESVAAGTPGNWAVKLFYARAALYEGTYRKYHPELELQNTSDGFLQKARELANEIISSGQFSVYSTGHPETDYRTLFTSESLLSNNEVILANIYDTEKERSGNINSTVFGDYEQSPSRDLVQAYLMKDGSRLSSQPGFQEFQFVQEFQNRDPRLSQTLVYPGWISEPNTRPYIQRLNKNFSGYHQLKGYINNIDNDVRGSVDFPVYRYAEALLIYAEASAELDNLNQTDLDISINLLRDRAGMPHLNLAWANANPDPWLSAKYPNVNGPNAGVVLEIRREKRVEFALEGYRYDDLMRWHAGQLLAQIPEGMYFPGLGKYDLTGDGIEDIILIDKDAVIPTENDKEKNSLGISLIYYKAGSTDDDVTVYLKNSLNGGTLVTETAARQFIEPQYYYRPVPYHETVLNTNLKQIFGW